MTYLIDAKRRLKEAAKLSENKTSVILIESAIQLIDKHKNTNTLKHLLRADDRLQTQLSKAIELIRKHKPESKREQLANKRRLRELEQVLHNSRRKAIRYICEKRKIGATVLELSNDCAIPLCASKKIMDELIGIDKVFSNEVKRNGQVVWFARL